MSTTLRVTTPYSFKSDAPAGTIEAVFSTFGVVDRGGDIIDPGAIENGKSVPMVWAHDWSKMIGKGTTRVDATQAIFTGQMFLDTAAGAEAYATMQAMGDLLEYSWGFRVLDATWETQNEELVRRVTKAEIFEVSPVLVGEGLNTRTLALKHGQPFDEHQATVLAAVADLVDRSRSLADLRLKEGRVLSSASRDRLSSIKNALSGAVGDLTAILKETEPDAKQVAAVDDLLAQFLVIEARANGVVV